MADTVESRAASSATGAPSAKAPFSSKGAEGSHSVSEGSQAPKTLLLWAWAKCTNREGHPGSPRSHRHEEDQRQGRPSGTTGEEAEDRCERSSTSRLRRNTEPRPRPSHPKSLPEVQCKRK